MNILVCIKQVPGTTKVEIDKETGVLKRTGVESKINPFDLYAVETALRIKEHIGMGNITVITMGPPQAEQIIRETYMMGVDDGILVSDMRFAGSDVLATSYTLSQAIGVIGNFDLIICGKQTTDGDTAQVGPALAEFLGIVHVSWVNSIDDIDNKGIVVRQDLSDSTEIAYLSYPCLITVEKDIMQPRLPSYKRKLETVNKPVRVITLDDFKDKDPNNYGLNGSATKVERIFPPEENNEQIIIRGSKEELSEQLYNIIKSKKII